MSTWYILPNGNIKNADGLELQPERDWFPTDTSMADFSDRQRALGKSEIQIIKRMMDMAIEAETWAQRNLA
ncbi:hypothetical protein [Pusillimonas sp. ANT_WB101]|uniref:hypothetical protein n=1 Tax=Pusillimonas sp. ANT_WB101 TaxID=2597356 RepID=UPI0011EEEA1B|nr:hypothetical protein [Pusillimonas sp. ANT_WB101]KAA0892977.1 hypothetical protein FQ179_12015 [Pusillimonas sp. ANT_WB101]